MRTINDKKYYSSEDVCREFGVTAKTWNRWRSKYNVKQVRIGALLLFPSEEIERIIKQSEETYKPTGRNAKHYTDDK